MAKVTFGGLLADGVEVADLIRTTEEVGKLRSLMMTGGEMDEVRANSLIEDYVAAKIEGAGREVIDQAVGRLKEVVEVRKQVQQRYGGLGEKLRAGITPDRVVAEQGEFKQLFQRLEQLLDGLRKQAIERSIKGASKVDVGVLLKSLAENEPRRATRDEFARYEIDGLQRLNADLKVSRNTVARQILDHYLRLSDSDLESMANRGNRLAAELLIERPRRFAGPEDIARFRSKPLEDVLSAAEEDPVAGDVVRRYVGFSDEELGKLERSGDTLARDILDQRLGGRQRPFTPDVPSDLPRLRALQGELDAFRDRVEARRQQLEAAGIRKPKTVKPPKWKPWPKGWRVKNTGKLVPKKVRTLKPPPVYPIPTAKELGLLRGTLGVAQADVPAMEGKTLYGASPDALGPEVQPTRPPAEQITPPKGVHQKALKHAEQDLANQLDEALSSLSPEEYAGARNRTVHMRIDQEVCTICGAGKTDPSRLGVLLELSRRHPEINFEITTVESSKVIRMRSGRYVEGP